MVLGSLIFGLLGLASAAWVLYDVFTVNKKLNIGMKLLWAALALLFSIITAIVYYFMYKKK